MGTVNLIKFRIIDQQLHKFILTMPACKPHLKVSLPEDGRLHTVTHAGALRDVGCLKSNQEKFSCSAGMADSRNFSEIRRKGFSLRDVGKSRGMRNS